MLPNVCHYITEMEVMQEEMRGCWCWCRWWRKEKNKKMSSSSRRRRRRRRRRRNCCCL